MISYSTNWMGPVSTKWYEDRQIPFSIAFTSGIIFNVTEYKEYTESYSCGRIDIYGLDSEEYWGGKHEYSLSVMRTEDWNALGDWLDKLETDELMPYDLLIERFEEHYGKIRWSK